MALRFPSRPSLVAYVDLWRSRSRDHARRRLFGQLAPVLTSLSWVCRFPIPWLMAGHPASPPSAPLENGTRLADVLEWRVKSATGATLDWIIFFRISTRAAFAAALCGCGAQAGVDGALITDLTVEEAGEYLDAMRCAPLATVFLAAPTSTNERLRRIAQASTVLCTPCHGRE